MQPASDRNPVQLVVFRPCALRSTCQALAGVYTCDVAMPPSHGTPHTTITHKHGNTLPHAKLCRNSVQGDGSDFRGRSMTCRGSENCYPKIASVERQRSAEVSTAPTCHGNAPATSPKCLHWRRSVTWAG